MERTPIDTTVPRTEVRGFVCPLGVYPLEPDSYMPAPGYRVEFEAADGGGDEGDWEEWPDRYVFDAVVSHDRLDALLLLLFSLLPGRVYPILDVLGQDAYREVDPYIAYELVGNERFFDAFRRRRSWLLEDGMNGFGAMSIEPFLYVYVDEHKILTVRCEAALKDAVERVLHAFDLEQREEPAGVDSVDHEHRSVLLATAGRPEWLELQEVIEDFRAAWRLSLNIDAESNVDDDGRELGVTAWRTMIRRYNEDGPSELVETFVTADSLDAAERLALDAMFGAAPDDAGNSEAEVISADRIRPEELADRLGADDPASLLTAQRVHAVRPIEPR